MRIFNEEKTKELKDNEIDYEKGHLVQDTLITKIAEQKGQEEVSHYVVIKEYENGGKDVEKVIDKPYIPFIAEHEESEDIYVYKEYSQKELNSIKIIELKQQLANTDYQAIKYAEGELTAEEYAQMKQQRKLWRAEINILEKQL